MKKAIFILIVDLILLINCSNSNYKEYFLNVILNTKKNELLPAPEFFFLCDSKGCFIQNTVDGTSENVVLMENKIVWQNDTMHYQVNGDTILFISDTLTYIWLPKEFKKQ